MSDIIDQATERPGRKEFRRLIMKGDNFQIVIDNDGDIDWYTEGNYWTDFPAKDVQKFNKIVNKAAELELICDSGAEFAGYKRLIAEALARALDRDLSAASEMLIVAEGTLRGKLRDRTRLRYLLAGVCFSIPSVFLLLVVWLSRDFLSGFIGHNAFWVIVASSSGALGALLSVILRNSEPGCSETAKLSALVVEAGTRILGGAIAGSIIAVAVKSGWVLEPISNGSHGNATAIIAAFAAGYLERLTPTLVKQFEGRVQKSFDSGTEAPTPPQGRREAGGSGRTAKRRDKMVPT